MDDYDDDDDEDDDDDDDDNDDHDVEEEEDDNHHQVSFVGEPGLDMGGLTKEWFQVPKKNSRFYVAFYRKVEIELF